MTQEEAEEGIDTDEDEDEKGWEVRVGSSGCGVFTSVSNKADCSVNVLAVLVSVEMLVPADTGSQIAG